MITIVTQQQPPIDIQANLKNLRIHLVYAILKQSVLLTPRLAINIGVVTLEADQGTPTRSPVDAHVQSSPSPFRSDTLSSNPATQTTVSSSPLTPLRSGSESLLSLLRAPFKSAEAPSRSRGVKRPYSETGDQEKPLPSTVVEAITNTARMSPPAEALLVGRPTCRQGIQKSNMKITRPPAAAQIRQTRSMTRARQPRVTVSAGQPI
jgi:hypothetical protein